MVGGDVEQHGHVGAEVVHVVELEAAQFHDVDVVRPACHLHGERAAYVAGKGCVESCEAQDVACEHGSGGLAVAACQAHAARGGREVSSGELDFADYVYASAVYRAHDGCVVGYSGAFHHFVGVEYALHGVAALLPLDAFGVEDGGVARGHGAVVAQEHVHAFVLCEDGGACAAFAGSEHHDFFLFHHRILRVTNVITASMMPMIQKRVTILASGMAWRGHCMRAGYEPSPGFW